MLCNALNGTKTSTKTTIIIASEVVVFIDFGRRLKTRIGALERAAAQRTV
jgi:hypothetical protein